MDESTTTRRLLPGTVVVLAVLVVSLLLAVASAVVATRTYDDAVAEERAASGRLAYEAAASSAQYLRGRVDLLRTFGGRSGFVAGDPARVLAQLGALPTRELFLDGGTAWYDTAGALLAARPAEGPPREVAAPDPAVREFVAQVLAGAHQVSAVVSSPEYDGEVVLLGVPTLDAAGGPNGVLTAGVRVEWLREVAERQGELRGSTSFIFDRAGRVVVGSVEDGYQVPDPATLPGASRRGNIDLAARGDDRDPSGTGDRLIGYARDQGLTGWTSLEVRSEHAAYADARSSLQRTLLGVGSFVVAAVLGAFVAGRRLNRLARRTRAAEEATALERERAEEEHRDLLLTLDATQTGTWRWDPAAGIAWSPEVRRVLGIEQDLPADPGAATDLIHPEDRPLLADVLGRVAAEGGAADVEVRPQRDPSRWIWIRASAVGGGRVVGLVRDVTERRTADERLRSASAREREIAWTLQQSLLPPSLPELEGLTVVARYRAAGPDVVVGGDFYDVVPAADGTSSLVIGDVCGRGVEAATVTSLARHTLRAAARHSASPATDLLWLHDALVASGMPLFLTAIALRVAAPRGGGVDVALALGGHPQPVLLPVDGPPRSIGVPGTMLGFAAPRITDATLRLRSGDRVVLYTDGLTDTPHPRLDDEALLALVATVRHLEPEEMADALLRASSPPEGRMHDDTALVVLRVDATS